MDNYRKSLGPKLEDLRAKGLFCDVTMVFPRDGKKMHVHRNILASCSEYFRTLFTFNMTTSGHIEIEIPSISFKDMEAIVQYAYTHEVDLDGTNIESIIVTADQLNVLGLLKACEDFLLDHMGTENVVGMMKMAKYLHCTFLEKSARKFVLKNFDDVSKNSNEFLQLTPDELMHILRADELIMESEDCACAAMMRWIDYQPEVRSAFLSQLFRSIRLGLLSFNVYDDLIGRYSYLPVDSEAQRLLQKGYEMCVQVREESPWARSCQYCQSLGNPMLRPRVPNEVIFVLGGWSRDGVCADMETFDNRVEKWYENASASFEHSVAYHAMVSLGKVLYVIGGYTAVKYLNSAKKFEPCSKTWLQIAPMHWRRCYVCAAEVDGLIYACGGYDGVHRHRSVECYFPVKNLWQMVADMNSVRSDAGACGVEGKLYVAGGFSGTECLNTIECLNPTTNQWTFLTPMSYRRSGVTVVAFKHSIYAIGGFNGHVRLDEVEKFYPSRNAWFPVKEMIKGRSNFAAAVVENKIYVVGGYDGSGTTGHVECYDCGRDEWSETNSLHVGRSAASACTVIGLDNVQEFTFYGTEAQLYMTPESPTHTQSFNGRSPRYLKGRRQKKSKTSNSS